QYLRSGNPLKSCALARLRSSHAGGGGPHPPFRSIPRFSSRRSRSDGCIAVGTRSRRPETIPDSKTRSHVLILVVRQKRRLSTLGFDGGPPVVVDSVLFDDAAATLPDIDSLFTGVDLVAADCGRCFAPDGHAGKAVFKDLVIFYQSGCAFSRIYAFLP